MLENQCRACHPIGNQRAVRRQQVKRGKVTDCKRATATQTRSAMGIVIDQHERSIDLNLPIVQTAIHTPSVPRAKNQARKKRKARRKVYLLQCQCPHMGAAIWKK